MTVTNAASLGASEGTFLFGSQPSSDSDMMIPSSHSHRIADSPKIFPQARSTATSAAYVYLRRDVVEIGVLVMEEQDSLIQKSLVSYLPLSSLFERSLQDGCILRKWDMR